MSSSTPPAIPIPALHRRVPQHLARRFAQICTVMQTEAHAALDLSPWHVALLAQVKATPGMDRNGLAAAIGIDATSTGQALDQFCTRGLVLRAAKPGDRRAAAFSLTPAGEALHAEAVLQSRAVAQRLLAPLAPAEADTLLDLLGRLVEAHEALARPGAGRRRPQKTRKEGESS
jgi:DNA-binding MarR family transcriptional regulator